MEITLYLDVLILVNFFMDFFLLWLLRMILKLKGSRLRLAAGSAAGAIFSALAQWLLLWLELSGLSKGIWRLLLWLTAVLGIGSGMLLCAFRLSGIREFIKAGAGLFFGAALTEGLLECGLAGWAAFSGQAQEAGMQNLAAWLFFLAGGCLAVHVLWKETHEAAAEQTCRYQVTLYHQGRQVCAEGFLDTGNRLKEPVTGRPVHVADRVLLETVCPKVEKVSLIPYRTIDGGGSSLKAVTLDRMEAVQGRRRLVYEHPLVAASPKALQMRNGCRVLLHE